MLSTECLRYMYRLLFLLYIEARPQLGFAPMNAEAYAKGYSLEPCVTSRWSRWGPTRTERPLHLGHDRHAVSDRFRGNAGPGIARAGGSGGFHLCARKGPPLRPGCDRNLSRRIALPKLSDAGDRRASLGFAENRGRSRGRISYVNLGISQLGAVYELLLSFSGFFADEDLIELKPADEKSSACSIGGGVLRPATAGEGIRDDGDRLRGRLRPSLSEGDPIYRLSGRNRENSASYYTPEPLARVLVKYALKELLEGKEADDILNLKVIEPAMGSAAFLVEVVNQLTDKYLELKQAELDRRIPHEERADVERRVRAYIADRNVFGVDLNPIAVELGQISLWLNCLHKGGHAGDVTLTPT